MNTDSVPTRLLPPLWLLVAVSALGPLVLNGVLPANTVIMRELETNYGLVQLVLTVYLLANMIAQLVLGNLSDSLGRKPIMLVSLSIFSIGSFLCASASSIEWLLMGRFVQGFGAAVCSFLPRTIVRDIYSRDKSASVIGYMTTAMMIAPLFGPALGGWITDVSSWRLMYVLLGVVSGLLVIVCWFFQHETLQRSTKSLAKMGFVSSSRMLLRERDFQGLGLILCGSAGVYYAFLGGAPYVVMELHGFSASEYGLFFACVAVGYLTGNMVAGRFSSQLGVFRMITVGLIPGLIGVVLFWLLAAWSHPLGLFLPMLVVAFSNGICIPNLGSAMMSVNTELAGAASGLSGTLVTAMGIILTSLLSLLLNETAMPLYWLMTLAAAIAISGVVVLRRHGSI